MPNELDRLGARWQKELRLRFIGEPQLAQQHIGRARVLVGQMEQGRRFIENGASNLRKVYADGVVVRAQYNGTTYVAEIDVTGLQPEPPEAPADIWFPQGFVIVPANDDAPKGWGIPVVDDDDVNVLDAGPKPDHWTADGALPQVLLSRAKNAGYPNKKRSTPLYYDTFEKPARKIKVPKQDGAWAAYRARFRDLGAGFMAILKEINTRRDPDQPLCPPLFGFADLANVYSRLVAKLGFDESHYPIGSNSIFRRLEKEGNVRITAEETARGILGTGTIDPGATVSDIVDALETSVPDLTNGTLKAGSSFSMVGNGQVFFALLDHTEQWIKVGNVDWRSIHSEIPSLSWSGPPGRSIPPDELALGFRRDPSLVIGSPVYIDEMQCDFHGQKIKLFDRFIYSRGRILAMLPQNGYVLGAAIQKIVDSSNPNKPPKYRLVCISWHKEDQYYQGQSGYVVLFDSTSDIRVWYADLPTRDGLACHPPYVIEQEFDADDNPYGWNQLGRHRLWSFGVNNFGPGRDISSASDPGNYADDNNRLSEKTYWQTWMFNGSGTEATCLRADVGLSNFKTDAGCVQVARAIKCLISDAPSSSIQSVWHSEGAPANTVNPQAFCYIAWDYDGDDERKVFVSGGDDAPSNGIIRSTTGAVILNTQWLNDDPFITGKHEPSLWYLDARSDSYIRVNSFVKTDTEEQLAAWPRSIAVEIGHQGGVVDSFNFGIAGGIENSYSSFNPFRYPYSFMREVMFPIAGSDADGHPYMMLGYGSIGGDYMAGIWYGASPSTYNGSGYFTDYVTSGSILSGSMDVDTLLAVESGWLNFAGVIL